MAKEDGLNSKKEQELYQGLIELRKNIETTDEGYIDWQLWLPIIGEFVLKSAMFAEHILNK